MAGFLLWFWQEKLSPTQFLWFKHYSQSCHHVVDSLARRNYVPLRLKVKALSIRQPAPNPAGAPQ